jgi:hypothetical protein
MLACFLALGSFAQGTTIKTIDFSTDEDGTPLVNGQHIESPEEFGGAVSISAYDFTLGAAIYDSDPDGPNADPVFKDMLVGLGNILIIQSPDFPTQTVPGIFDKPSDRTAGAGFFFDFTSPSRMMSIDLIDVDEDDRAEVRLIDLAGRSRHYDIPENWTHDNTISPKGYATLDMTSLSPQLGETDQLTSVTEDVGFDAASITRLEVILHGSGGIDNLAFVPEPTGLSWIGFFIFAALCRRQRGSGA